METQIPQLCLLGSLESQLDSTNGKVARHTLGNLKMLPIWVAPEHLVSTARFVLNGHRLAFVPVVENSRLLGCVTAEALQRALPDALVGSLIEPVEFVLDGATDVRTAAATFVAEDLSLVAVAEEGKFLGLLSATTLLRELNQSWDPLTELPWPETLRDWGITQLVEGREITLLCLDLNDFRLFNRRFGHAEGDRLLQALAQVISTVLDPKRDVLVRFAGDEFMVGSLRPHDEAVLLSGQIRDMTAELEGFINVPSLSIGISGGKRTREREHTHFAAMYDNLVKLAQVDCQAHKRIRPNVVMQPAEGEGSSRANEFEVMAVSQHTEPQPMTQVIIRVGSRVLGGVDGSADPDLSVAIAAARALESWSRDLRFEVDSVNGFDDPDGGHLMSVSGLVTLHGEPIRFAGGAKFENDRGRAIAEALLDGFARSSAASQDR
jgi:diguanylate cyclase (GGDEF)-like protein